jgi:hypothetical protein
MTEEQQGLLLTVARIMRGRLREEGSLSRHKTDLACLEAALKPFEADPLDDAATMAGRIEAGRSLLQDTTYNQCGIAARNQ